MNERIKQLAEQAGVTPMVQRSDGLYVVGADVFEKFAELIVKECNEYLRTNGGAFLVQGLKEHFGVEE